jgi:hypothetical protein
MPRKKSVRGAAQAFQARVDALDAYYDAVLCSGMTAQHVTWAVEAALMKLEAQFEHLVLHALVGAINNDTALLTSTTHVMFPKHLTDEVCEYLVVGSGYFDFRGRDGLIKTLKQYLPDSHYLITAVKKPAYKDPLDRLIALRNFAAHESAKSKKTARETVGTNMSAAGAWLKRQNRLKNISALLKRLAAEIEAGAPY